MLCHGAGGVYFRNFWVCRWDPGGRFSKDPVTYRARIPELVQLNFATPYESKVPKSHLLAVFQKLLRSLAQSSQNKTLYHNCFYLKKGFTNTCFSFRFSSPYPGPVAGYMRNNAKHARTHYQKKRKIKLFNFNQY